MKPEKNEEYWERVGNFTDKFSGEPSEEATLFIRNHPDTKELKRRRSD